MMKELGKLNVGLRQIEEFNIGLITKLRSEKMREKGEEITRKQVKSAMEIKLRDEERYHEEKERERNEKRREIRKKLVNNSRPYRALMRDLRDLAEKVKEDYRLKYSSKLSHLKEIFREEEESKIDKVPEGLKDYDRLSVFDRGRYEDIEIGEEEILVVSEGVELSDDERAVLRLHTKFSVIQFLQENGFEFEQELAYAKIRMERRRDLEEAANEKEDLSGSKEGEEEPPLLDEEEKREEEEAKLRQTFNPIEKVFDDRKRRVTDLQECTRVTLPKPLPVVEEALIEIRRDIHDRIYYEHLRDFTKMGEQIANMTEEEIRGLKSILKRIRAGELLVIKTDKSGRFCIVTVEDYLHMGKVHTDKDVMIGRVKVIEIEKTLNGHAISWVKIFNSGQDHGHGDRIMSSKVTRSENKADLYVLFKDHKPGGKTRPVVTGCTSNTRGLSNTVSNLLESFANSNDDMFESISGEDMLSKSKTNNILAKKIIEKWLARRLEKMKKNCNTCNLEEVMRSCKKCGENKDKNGELERKRLVECKNLPEGTSRVRKFQKETPAYHTGH